MDPNPPQISGGGEKEESLGQGKKIISRCCFSTVLFIGVSFSISLLFGLVAIAIGNFTAKSPVSVPSLCRIISSSVDIKSSKVCELGLLNYKAKHVLYPLSKGRKRFRCHHDYYWASIFEVEYKEYFSGQMLHGVAEAPKVALPDDCRPGFGTAWLTKMKFKVRRVSKQGLNLVHGTKLMSAKLMRLSPSDRTVNETYNCRYTLGSHRADFYTDDLFNCEAKDPSVSELVTRVFIQLMRSSVFDTESIGVKGAYMVAGAVSGMLTVVCCTILAKTLGRRWEARKHKVRAFAIRLRWTCVMVAYFSAVGWLMLEYGKTIGLRRLFSLGTEFAERIV